jgi:hypothetical protein
MVSARYYPYLGGIETHIHEVGKRMVARGHQVTVLTTDPSGNLLKYSVNNGIDIIRVKAYPKTRDYYLSFLRRPSRPLPLHDWRWRRVNLGPSVPRARSTS